MDNRQLDLDAFADPDPSEQTDDGSEPGPPPEPASAGFDGFAVDGDRVRHPRLEPGAVEARDYQLEIAAEAVRANTLVVLPTGLGKTVVAVLAAAEALDRPDAGKVLVLAPTKPLCQQHEETFRELLAGTGDADGAGLAVLAGRGPDARARAFEEARVLFSTPQGLRNDVADGAVNLAGVDLLVVDEAHRTVGDYAYVDLAQAYQEQRPGGRVLGLTASPGSDEDRVEEVASHLGIDAVEARTELSPDVAPHVFQTDVSWETTPLPDALVELRDTFQAIVDERVESLRESNFLPPKPYVGRKDLVEAGNKLKAALAKAGNKGPIFGLLHNQAVAMQALHCAELVETQGVEPLRDYLERLGTDPDSRAKSTFASDERVAAAREKARAWDRASHPKIPLLGEVLDRELSPGGEARGLVFAQYRDTIASILRALEGHGVAADRFVGQSDREDDPGMSQTEQQAALDRLREGEVEVLVASSVAEEGLDIPDVDLVVFYEPVPSEVRRVQRLGRTGRHGLGRVVMLVAEETRDEAFLHAGREREKQMRRIVEGLGDS